jgi:hypothetical protein
MLSANICRVVGLTAVGGLLLLIRAGMLGRPSHPAPLCNSSATSSDGDTARSPDAERQQC